MRDLRARFQSLDRVATPNLWNEAVGRAAELDGVHRVPFNRSMLLIGTALLLAALAGTIAIGAWLDQTLPDAREDDFANGMAVTPWGCGGIVRIDPETAAVTQLVADAPTCEEAGEYVSAEAAWSTDGRYLAYGVWRGCDSCGTPEGQAKAMVEAATGAWLYDTETFERRRVGDCPQLTCEGIDISPDGSLVGYISRHVLEGRNYLAVAEVESGDVHMIELPGYPNGGEFSPDGTHVALSVEGAHPGIYVVDVRELADRPGDDEPAPTLLYGPHLVDNVTWSPDGEWLAIDQTQGDEMSVIALRADGTDARILASQPAPVFPAFPSWSPDSTAVTYITMPELEHDGSRVAIWTAEVDGGEPTRIYLSECCMLGYSAPTWSPDGEWITFGVRIENAADSGVILIRPDGSDLRYASAWPLGLEWQPIPLGPADE